MHTTISVVHKTIYVLPSPMLPCIALYIYIVSIFGFTTTQLSSLTTILPSLYTVNCAPSISCVLSTKQWPVDVVTCGLPSCQKPYSASQAVREALLVGWLYWNTIPTHHIIPGIHMFFYIFYMALNILECHFVWAPELELWDLWCQGCFIRLVYESLKTKVWLLNMGVLKKYSQLMMNQT